MIEAAAAGDFDAICALLSGADLPVADLDPSMLGDFRVVRDGGKVVAAVALQPFGEVGLLRSLVVDAGTRGRGLGRRLVDDLERRAVAAGIGELWLLTIDADRFFSARGYRERDRSTAPAAIAATAEFSSLCPGDAVLMAKAIEAEKIETSRR